MRTVHILDERHDGWDGLGLEPRWQGAELLLDLPAAYVVNEGDTLVLTDAGEKLRYTITRAVPSDNGHTVSLIAEHAGPSLP